MVLVVDLHRAGLGVEGAVREGERRGFAGAGGADERNGLAGLHDETQVDNGRPFSIVGVRDVGEFDQSAHPTGIDGARPVAHGRCRRELRRTRESRGASVTT